MSSSKRNAVGRSKKKQGAGSLGWPKALIDEVRAIRNEESEREDNSHRLQTQNHDTLGFACELCNEEGSHLCFPELVHVLEQDEEFLEGVWQAYQQRKAQGVYDEQVPTLRTSRHPVIGNL